MEKPPLPSAPPRTPDAASARLLADVARAYYLRNQSKVDIARQFSLSRFQVAKMLEDARELGIVTIEIREQGRWSSSVEERLAAHLGVERVVVVSTENASAAEAGERLGIAVMEVLRETVRPRMTVGISWSRALDLAARYMPTLPPCTIVQLTGALQLPGAGSLARIIAQLGGNPGITTLPISAPLVVDRTATADDLMRQPEIAEALAAADHLDLAIVAIGAWVAGESTVYEKVSAADREAGTAQGAVAEISGRLLDAGGVPVHTALDGRTIGVRIEQLAGSGRVIAVARDVARVDAVRAAIKAGVVSVLIVDDALAQALIDTAD